MQESQIKVSVIGLGYVGLPVAVAMSKAFETIGYDYNSTRIDELRNGVDRTHEVTSEELKKTKIIFTHLASDLKRANFHIVAVPTPVDTANRPDLTPVTSASECVGRALKIGDIVVYESTVYPGLTEEKCIPILEKHSGLKAGIDFKVGYSPERINPGDKAHSFTKIKKVVSAQDAESLEKVAKVYGSVVEAGVFKASSIKVAEAAKIIEKTQRDLNIALMNELSLIFDRMGIDTLEVLEAAGTKWNFLKFFPGLVGGHCIGVDPYYLTHKAEELGYMPQVILSGRRINDSMGAFIAQKTVKLLAQNNHSINSNTVTVLGLTFKENCPDIRNSKVVDIIRELKEYGIHVQVHDPLARGVDTLHEYGIELVEFSHLKQASAVIVAVGHDEYRNFSPSQVKDLLKPSGVLLDIKGIYSHAAFREAGICLWRL